MYKYGQFPGIQLSKAISAIRPKLRDKGDTQALYSSIERGSSTPMIKSRVPGMYKRMLQTLYSPVKQQPLYYSGITPQFILRQGKPYQNYSVQAYNMSNKPVYVGFSGATEGKGGDFQQTLYDKYGKQNVLLYRYTDGDKALQDMHKLKRPIHVISSSWGSPVAHQVIRATPDIKYSEHTALDPIAQHSMPQPSSNVSKLNIIKATKHSKWMHPYLSLAGWDNIPKSDYVKELPVNHTSYKDMLGVR